MRRDALALTTIVLGIATWFSARAFAVHAVYALVVVPVVLAFGAVAVWQSPNSSGNVPPLDDVSRR
jgi:hypothetical protein